MALYQAYDPAWWKGRVDGKSASHLRWHQVIKGLDFDKSNLEGYALLGFSSDEGVRRNNGRTGAVKGPEHIQNAMCNFPVNSEKPIFDAGNVLCDNEDLEGAQKLLAMNVARIIRTGCTPVVLGGGHEVSWGHFHGLVQAMPDSNIGIINIDAHFDLRACQSEKSTSGTPFLQIAQFQEDRNAAFNYLVMGVQKHSNTQELFETADRLNTSYYLDTDFTTLQIPVLEQAIYEFADRVDHIYLTICMDVFNSAYAPGVSAVNVRGISPDEVTMSVLRTIAGTGKVLSFDIAEVNPLYDVDERTARLAALLVHDIIYELNR